MEQERTTVLVIEDDPSIAEMLREILELDGYRVEWAPNGNAGLARVGATDVDLVLLDVMLPGVSGIQVCQRIREQEAATRLPVVMLTVLSLPDDHEACLAAGADDYLAKPFDIDELLARVQHWTEARGRAETVYAR
jgi:DNA-binding response OmpR family regulator